MYKIIVSNAQNPTSVTVLYEVKTIVQRIEKSKKSFLYILFITFFLFILSSFNLKTRLIVGRFLFCKLIELKYYFDRIVINFETINSRVKLWFIVPFILYPERSGDMYRSTPVKYVQLFMQRL